MKEARCIADVVEVFSKKGQVWVRDVRVHVELVGNTHSRNEPPQQFQTSRQKWTDGWTGEKESTTDGRKGRKDGRTTELESRCGLLFALCEQSMMRQHSESVCNCVSLDVLHVQDRLLYASSHARQRHTGMKRVKRQQPACIPHDLIETLPKLHSKLELQQPATAPLILLLQLQPL